MEQLGIRLEEMINACCVSVEGRVNVYKTVNWVDRICLDMSSKVFFNALGPQNKVVSLDVELDASGFSTFQEQC